MNTVMFQPSFLFPFTFCFSWYTWKQIPLLHTLVYIKSNLNQVSQLSLKLYEYLLSLLNLQQLISFSNMPLSYWRSQASCLTEYSHSGLIASSYFNVDATLTLTEVKGKLSHNQNSVSSSDGPQTWDAEDVSLFGNVTWNTQQVGARTGNDDYITILWFYPDFNNVKTGLRTDFFFQRTNLKRAITKITLQLTSYLMF